MTTEPGTGFLRRLPRFAMWALVVLVAWTAVLAGLAFAAPPGTSVAVFTRPGRAADTAIRAGGSLEEFSGMIAVTRSPEPGFVMRLYRAGALLVLDARVVSGCRAVLKRGRKLFD